MTQLIFELERDDEWPPVAKECLTCSDCGVGYKIQVPPLFIKDMSVGDVVSVEMNDTGDVVAWRHLSRSRQSTAWIMASPGGAIESVIECLKNLSCNVVRFEEYRYFAVDIPAEVRIEDVDACLGAIKEGEASFVFPSFRHE